MSLCSWLNEGPSQVFWNVVGGGVTAALFESYAWARRSLLKKSFTEVFGKDVGSSDFHLVYALFCLKDLMPPDPMPYRKPGFDDVSISISHPVSFPEVRAAKYLSEGIASNRFSPPCLTPDCELNAKMDVSFVAFGGPLSNLKSRDAINCRNALVKFDNKEFLSPHSDRKIVVRQPGFDYGLILKVQPPQFPSRTWFTCAGVSEWGTSGAAWYLAKKWKEIHGFAGRAPFAIIVKVREGQDEYAEPVLRVTTASEVKKAEIK